jgi:hypothetical protein
MDPVQHAYGSTSSARQAGIQAPLESWFWIPASRGNDVVLQ